MSWLILKRREILNNRIIFLIIITLILHFLFSIEDPFSLSLFIALARSILIAGKNPRPKYPVIPPEIDSLHPTVWFSLPQISQKILVLIVCRRSVVESIWIWVLISIRLPFHDWSIWVPLHWISSWNPVRKT